jgi:hypothetical protein
MQELMNPAADVGKKPAPPKSLAGQIPKGRTTTKISTREFFRLLGLLIARFPVAWMVASTALALLSLGIAKMELQDKIREGYTPRNAPSHYESAVMREFWSAPSSPVSTLKMNLTNSTAIKSVANDPMVSVVLITSKQGNMLDLAHLREAVTFARFLRSGFRFATADTGEQKSYTDLCKQSSNRNLCNDNMPLEIFTVEPSEREFFSKNT